MLIQNPVFVVLTTLLILIAGCSGPAGVQTELTGTEDGPTPITPTTTNGGQGDAVQTPTNEPTPTPSPTATPIPTPTFTPTPIPNPWNSDTAIVAINKSVDPDRNYAGLVQAALTYWQEEGAEYRKYDIRFVVRPNASDPDIVVKFVDSLSKCGYEYSLDAAYAGCASVLSAQSNPDDPEVVTILAGLVREDTILTLKHEFGHIYGINHNEEPMPLMSETYDYTFISKPDVSERAYPWQRTNLSVHIIHNPDKTESQHKEVRKQVEHALDYYADGADGWMAANVSFYFVDDREEADVLIQFTDESSKDDGSIGTNWGRDIDTDDNLEYYTFVNISVDGIRVDRRAWHVGYWLGFTFGANEIEELPPPFDEPDSDPREDWWK